MINLAISKIKKQCPCQEVNILCINMIKMKTLSFNLEQIKYCNTQNKRKRVNVGVDNSK